jgi:hypothetical protein
MKQNDNLKKKTTVREEHVYIKVYSAYGLVTNVHAEQTFFH